MSECGCGHRGAGDGTATCTVRTGGVGGNRSPGKGGREEGGQGLEYHPALQDAECIFPQSIV